MSSNIPDTWIISTIGELSEYIQRGKSPKYAERSSLPVINQKCIRWNLLELQHLKFIHPDQIPSWDEPRYIRNGDILWNSTGTGTVGRAYFVKKDDTILPKVVDSHVTIVRPHPLIVQRFIYYWIKSPSVQQRIVEMCDGTTNQIELSRATISATEIPLAPLAEQKRIADKLDNVLERVDACRERLNRVPLLLKRFKQSVLAAATSGKLTEDWRTKAVVNQGRWQTQKAEVLCEWITKGTTPSREKMTDAVGDVPYIKVYNLCFDGKLDFTVNPTFVDQHTHQNVLKRSVIFPGDVLMNIVGPPLGKVSIVPNTYPEWNINQAIAVFRVKPELDNRYLAYFLMNENTIIDLIGKSKATAGQFNLTLEICRKIDVPLPLMAEQIEIVRRVEALFAFADRLEARLATARNATERLTPALLAKAFRGELIEQDPNDEPAIELLKRLKSNLTEKTKPLRRGTTK